MSFTPGDRVRFRASEVNTDRLWLDGEVASSERDGLVALRLPGPPGQDDRIELVDTDNVRQVEAAEPTPNTEPTSTSQVPPDPAARPEVQRQQGQRLRQGFCTADGSRRDLVAFVRPDGAVSITLRDADSTRDTILWSTTLTRDDINQVVQAWRSFSPNISIGALSKLSFGMVPTMADTFSGTDQPFGGAPPEVTERVLDWLTNLTPF